MDAKQPYTSLMVLHRVFLRTPPWIHLAAAAAGCALLLCLIVLTFATLEKRELTRAHAGLLNQVMGAAGTASDLLQRNLEDLVDFSREVSLFHRQDPPGSCSLSRAFSTGRTMQFAFSRILFLDPGGGELCFFRGTEPVPVEIQAALEQDALRDCSATLAPVMGLPAVHEKGHSAMTMAAPVWKDLAAGREKGNLAGFVIVTLPFSEVMNQVPSFGAETPQNGFLLLDRSAGEEPGRIIHFSLNPFLDGQPLRTLEEDPRDTLLSAAGGMVRETAGSERVVLFGEAFQLVFAAILAPPAKGAEEGENPRTPLMSLGFLTPEAGVLSDIRGAHLTILALALLTIAIFLASGITVFVASKIQAGESERVRRSQVLAVKALAETAAHNIYQPLTALRGTIEVWRLRRNQGPSPLTAAEESLLRDLEKEAGRIEELVRQMNSIMDYHTREYVGESRILALPEAPPPAAAKGPPG